MIERFFDRLFVVTALGSATIGRAEERRVENLKNIGYNAIRTSHNPVSPAFLAACDRLGVLVMHEAFDCFEDGKNSNDYHVYFDAWWQRDLATMVKRTLNHPSVRSLAAALLPSLNFHWAFSDRPPNGTTDRDVVHRQRDPHARHTQGYPPLPRARG